MTIFEVFVISAIFICCTVLIALVLTTIFLIACWVFKTEVDITPENDKEVGL